MAKNQKALFAQEKSARSSPREPAVAPGEGGALPRQTYEQLSDYIRSPMATVVEHEVWSIVVRWSSAIAPVTEHWQPIGNGGHWELVKTERENG